MLKKQALFVAEYNRLLNSIPEDEPVLFADGVHASAGNQIELWMD
jgi:hypothetical protein